jgi:GrpB-like predicted nucleotidyltransferase (UPF0157 family)
MRIFIVPYLDSWNGHLHLLKEELGMLLFGLDPVVAHIGSTSVPNLAAKPIIDLSMGLRGMDDFDSAVAQMANHEHYIYYKAFESAMPQRRWFVRLNAPVFWLGFKAVFEDEDEIPQEAIHERCMAHVHLWLPDSPDWVWHRAFSELLKQREDLREAYGSLKRALS